MNLAKSIFSSCLCLLLIPVSLFACGKLFSTIPADSLFTPQHRAIVIHHNGRETFILQEQFSGANTDFAWVIPVPAYPEVEVTSSGIFTTLDFLTGPIYADESRQWFYIFLTGLILVAILFSFTLHGRFRLVTSILCIVVLVILIRTVSVPTFASYQSTGTLPLEQPEAVRVHTSKQIGVYDIRVMSSQEPDVLLRWLNVNGYQHTARSDALMKDYAQQGWFFVAAKVHQSAAGRMGESHSYIQPLKLTFASDAILYPLWLTTAERSEAEVVLYVFAPEKVDAAGFHTAFADRLYPDTMQYKKAIHHSTGTKIHSTSNREETAALNFVHGVWPMQHIAHPLLLQWVPHDSYLTKLQTTINQDSIPEDVTFSAAASSKPFRQTVYKTKALQGVALDSGLLLWLIASCALLCGGPQGTSIISPGAIRAFSGCAIVAGLIGALLLWQSSPKFPWQNRRRVK